MDNKTVQRHLQTIGLYTGPIDGLIGPKSLEAIGQYIVSHVTGNLPKWNPERKLLAAKQLILIHTGFEAGAIDGLMGPQTRTALEEWARKDRDAPEVIELEEPKKSVKTVWPRQSEVDTYYGPKGESQTMLELPYPMRISWDLKKEVLRMSLHQKVAPSAGRVLSAALKHYGIEEIKKLHLDRWSGSLNVRKMRGGTKWSMHSWGIAIDFDDGNNQYLWGRDRALFAKLAYEKWWQLWEAEGWVSLGRARNYDWMHVQAARL